ncbi:MAG: hypothetical protein M1823_005908 [Watsoniomyces obsoletus]|nr:MAG: hypothetical protein M1823_005908 [Watsoniomyces obsoletus]
MPFFFRRKEHKVTDNVIRPGGRGIVPAIDAPKSAVNAGERRVKVMCGETVVTLPVLPSTTARDLVRAASRYVSQPIAPETTTVVETFMQLGLERRVRKYEHIRDVMNSWGRDTQNGLMLVPLGSNGSDEILDVQGAPHTQPGESTAYLYHSTRPGKWKKVWATLRADGQMVVSKKAGQPPKHTSNICHLSDFDVYNVTPKQLSSSVRPPKRYCLAVKSQQKSSMFLTTEKFVHFFSTDDSKMWSQWHRVIQQWRSWYLVSRLGEGGIPRSPPERTDEIIGVVDARRPSGGRQVHGSREGGQTGQMHRNPTTRHGRRGSQDPANGQVEQQHHHRSRPPTDDSNGGEPSRTRTQHRRNQSSREHRAPPVSFPANMIPSSPDAGSRSPDNALIQGISPQEMRDATFAPTGLLGRTYSQRQRMQQEREAAAKQQGPFINGPSLLNSDAPIPPPIPAPGRPSIDESARPGRTMSMRSTKEGGGGVARPGTSSASAVKPHKPLLDFSNPEYREPPQHVRKGRGYVPQQPLPGGLIDAATTPDVPIAIPPATAWRRQHPPSLPTSSPPGVGVGVGVEDHSEQQHQQPRRTQTVKHTGPTRQTSLRRNHTRTGENGGGGGGVMGGSMPERARTTRRAHHDDHNTMGGSSSSPAGGPMPERARTTTRRPEHGIGTGTGRGVRTGDRNAQTPMLDLRETSKFVPGSLLARAEATSKEGGGGN